MIIPNWSVFFFFWVDDKLLYIKVRLFYDTHVFFFFIAFLVRQTLYLMVLTSHMILITVTLLDTHNNIIYDDNYMIFYGDSY